MLERDGIKWNRNETILALDLYFRTPFGQISKSNKNIQALAEMLGRTPSSVGLKMANLASCDPTLLASNRHGMANGSKLDKEIFKEYAEHLDQLAVDAELIRNEYQMLKAGKQDLEDKYFEQLPYGKDVERETRQRVGQTFFRDAVLSAYDNRCCITEIDDSKLLIASHIKPWAESGETEKTDPRNGLCLNSLHDRCFDAGLMTLDEDYRVVLSNRLAKCDMDEQTKDWLFSYNGKQIHLPDRSLPRQDFLDYHRKEIFLG